MRTPETITGQGLSPYAYYRQAAAILFPGTEYIARETHQDVTDDLKTTGRDILVADTALYGGIEDSREAMPDVFLHPKVMSYGAAILDITFKRYRHPDISTKEITTWLTQRPVFGHCESSIREVESALGRELEREYVSDSGQSAEHLRDNDGRYNGQPAYAICSPVAGDACGLIEDGDTVMNDKKSATRFIAYNNEGYFDESGSHQVIAVRVPNTNHGLLDMLKSGFGGVNMTSLVHLGNTDDDEFSDFAIEIQRDNGKAMEIIGKLQDNDYLSRLLGQYSPLDQRAERPSYDDYDYGALESEDPEVFTVCLDMNDEDGGLIERLQALELVNITDIRISESLNNFGRVVALHISHQYYEKVIKLLKGKGVFLNIRGKVNT